MPLVQQVLDKVLPGKVRLDGELDPEDRLIRFFLDDAEFVDEVGVTAPRTQRGSLLLRWYSP